MPLGVFGPVSIHHTCVCCNREAFQRHSEIIAHSESLDYLVAQLHESFVRRIVVVEGQLFLLLQSTPVLEQIQVECATHDDVSILAELVGGRRSVRVELHELLARQLGRLGEHERKVVHVRSELDHVLVLLLGHFLVVALVGQAVDEALGDIETVAAALHLGVHVLEADELADELDDAVCVDAVAGGLLFGVHLGEVVLFVEVVEECAALASVYVEQTLRGVQLGELESAARRRAFAHAQTDDALAVAGDREHADGLLLAQYGLVLNHGLERDDARVELTEVDYTCIIKTKQNKTTHDIMA